MGDTTNVNEQIKDIVRSLGIIEEEINFYKTQTALGIIEIGKRLIEAKEQLKHGEWGKWLEEKVDFKKSTANNFMRVAKEFPNFQTLGNLTQSKLFALLDVPEEKREDFIQENDVNEMTTRQLKDKIRSLKDEAIEIDEMKVIDIEVEKLKLFYLHNKYFKNITGEEWIGFLNSIQSEGVIQPILISQDYVIVSGHQRVRACKDLNLETIPCRIKKYINNENELKEEAMLRDCLLSNFKLHSDDFEIARNALQEHGWL
ncbi:MAG TPA: DUF3102 domain-containing protein [Epulopiscium sp.]|nr:DUF3102 domain-containing protein [Candidatus Epulonipiscium sp.]